MSRHVQERRASSALWPSQRAYRRSRWICGLWRELVESRRSAKVIASAMAMQMNQTVAMALAVNGESGR